MMISRLMREIRIREIWLAGATVIVFSATTVAHPGRVSFSRIWLEGNEIHQSLKLLTDELGEALPLDQNSNGLVEAEEILTQRSRVEAYLAQKLIVENEGSRLSLVVDRFDVRLEEVSDSEPQLYLFCEVRFQAVAPLQQLTFRNQILDDVDERHDNFAKIELNGQIRPYVFTSRNEFTTRMVGLQTVTATPSGTPWKSAASFLRHGIVHIFQGYDHILFLIGLLLVATTFLSTVKIVTAFTVGHSISLTLAALNIVQLPRNLLESMIALTIVYVALENIFAKSTGRRWMISLSFGLIHGLAFAETLQLMGLSTRELITALLSFNVGIEIAQIVIVGLTIPLILAMALRSWRLQAVRASSMLILCLATLWFFQRAADMF